MILRFITLVLLPLILSSGIALSSVSLKNYSNSFENFKNYIEQQKFLIDTLEQPNAEYYTNYLDSLSDLNTELSVLNFFRESTIIEPQYVYTHYILSLNKLNKLSKDYETNQDMLQGSFQNLFFKENSYSNDKNNIVDKIDTACLCATEGLCEGQETESACMPNSEPEISKLVPIAGLGGMLFAINDTSETPVYSGTTKTYHSSIADEWLSNSEYKLVNFAGDTALMTAYEDLVINRPGYINKGLFNLVQGVQDSPHPYTQLGVNDAYGYGLSGLGITISVIDNDLCYSTASGTYSSDVFDHFDLRDKTVITYGTYTYPIYNSASQWNNSSGGHGCHVSTTALGTVNNSKPSDSSNIPFYQWWDTGTTDQTSSSIDLPNSIMGVAYNASLHFADYNPTSGDGVGSTTYCDGDDAVNCFGPQHLELATEDGIANNAKVQNNSWGWSGDTTAETIMAYGSGSNVTRLAEWMSSYESEGSGSTINFSETQVRDWIDSYDNFQKQGVIVWANSNDNNNNMSTVWSGTANIADASSNLPALFPELSEAWITVSNVGTYSNGAKLLYSAPCGTSADYCVVHDGIDITAGSDVYDGAAGYSHWITTMYGTSIIHGLIIKIALKITMEMD